MSTTQQATFAAGCFWGIEHKFRQIPGVIDAVSGYTGGHRDNPTYKQVCYEDTGHAEAVQVTFDPARVSYETLLAAFWKMHDPTQHNRQGPDIGSQYRSAIFYHDDAQKAAAEQSKKKQQGTGMFAKKIATQIAPAATFWRAEEYHQRYVEKSGGSACAI